MRLFPNALLHCFEPVPAAAAVLRRAAPRAVVHELALGEARYSAPIHVHPSDDGSSFVVGAVGAHDMDVPVRTLDELGLAFERPALLKMDVQGYENRVLAGASETLRQIDQVFFEDTDALDGSGRSACVLRTLQAAGFIEAERRAAPWGGADVLMLRAGRGHVPRSGSVG